ncbi:TMV resistance protein N-like protein [Tanacetum coccineum]
MDSLKLLQLKHVELNGSYENFPEIRWLCWYRSCLKRVPSGLLMSSLVAIDMTDGDLEEFELPVALNLLKILNLKGCVNLVSVCNLHLLPNLETLILWDCSKLTNVTNIVDLVSLDTLDLTGCNRLLTTLLNKKLNLQESQALRIDGKIPQQAMVSLPDSLKCLFLNSCGLKYNNEVPVASNGQPFFYMNLGHNLFQCLKYSNDFQTLRILDVTFCLKLKSLLYLPSTLEELYTYSCYLLEKITFQSAQFRLRGFGYEDCNSLSEIQGLFSLVSVEKIDDADLGHLKWIKSCEYGAVNLVGDDIVKERFGHMMLHEFGIMSTYLPGITYEPMMHEYISSSSFLSFIVPSCPKKRKIKGLNVTSLYKSTGEDILALLAKVSNKTKGLTWIYNPVVYSEPEADEDVVWLSYWPIGNILDTGDEVNVDIIVGNGFIVSGCGATLVYMDGELCQENCKYMVKEEEVIGGDLSEFELSKGAFYLCRRDFFKSMTPDWLKMLVGDTIHYKELKGWKNSRQSCSKDSYSELKTFRGFHQLKIVLKVDIHDVKQRIRAMKAISGIKGIESIAVDLKDGTLTVTGDVDPVRVVARSRKVVATDIIIRSSSVTSYNPSAFPNLQMGKHSQPRSIYQKLKLGEKPLRNALQLRFSDAVLFAMTWSLICTSVEKLQSKVKRSASIHHHIMQTSDDHGVVHGAYVVEEGDGQLVEEGGGPLVVVEGGGPRGLQVVKGGGGRLVVGGEDGGGEVVILASC